MPKLSANRVPSYRLHKQSGQAIVTLDGKDHLLGKHGSDESREKYNRLISEWLANGRRSPENRVDPGIMLVEIADRYEEHAREYYRLPSGAMTSEVCAIASALRPLLELYGTTPANEFGPLALEAVRNKMISLKWGRQSINKQIHRIRRMFKWAAGRQLIPGTILHDLQSLEPLKKGRSAAVESEKVKEVPVVTVEQTLPFLPKMLQAMVKLQLATGMRPGEVCAMRNGDIDASGKIWIYRPAHHKTAHFGYSRVIAIGPKGQEILRPYLRLVPDAHVFSPRASEEERRAEQHDRRLASGTPLNQGNRPGTNRSRKPKCQPGKCYRDDNYRRAIQRACDQAFPPPAELDKPEEELTEGEIEQLEQWRADHRWHPNQLRHTAATEIRRQFGIEAVQAVLGHQNLSTSEIYAEKDLKAAVDVMMKIG